MCKHGSTAWLIKCNVISFAVVAQCVNAVVSVYICLFVCVNVSAGAGAALYLVWRVRDLRGAAG